MIMEGNDAKARLKKSIIQTERKKVIKIFRRAYFDLITREKKKQFY